MMSLDRFCHVKLLTLVLVLHYDVDRVLTDVPPRSPSWQCKSAYCSHRHTPASPEVKFTDKPRPATLAQGCLGRQVDLICCTANFARISWLRRVDDTTWEDFLSVDPDNRCLSEGNQTASIVDSLSKEHEGWYKCMAQGHNGDVISNEVELVVEDCDNYHKPPTSLSLFKNVTEVEASIGHSADVLCSGFFGEVTCPECAIGWIRHRFNLIDFERVPLITNASVNTSERVYAENIVNGSDQMLSRLHIKKVMNADYSGWYKCWMSNSYNYTLRLVRFIPESQVEVTSVYKIVAIACGCVLAFVVVLCIVLWPLRHDIQLAVKQRRRTPPNLEGLDYDVLLLHVDSVDTNNFGTYLYRRLAELSRPPYEVFHFNERDYGQGIFEAMRRSLTSSRCALVVLCRAFVERYNETWFHLEQLITDVDVIYVLSDGLDVATVTQTPLLGAAIAASIRNSIRKGHCLTWSWPVENEANLGRMEKLKIARFWCHLKLAIPNRRQTPIQDEYQRLLPGTVHM